MYIQILHENLEMDSSIITEIKCGPKIVSILECSRIILYVKQA